MNPKTARRRCGSPGYLVEQFYKFWVFLYTQRRRQNGTLSFCLPENPKEVGMKCVSSLCASRALCLFALSICVMWSGVAFAAFSLPSLPGPGQAKSVTGGSDAASGESRAAKTWKSHIALKEAVTIIHPTKNFRVTIPAGWNSEDMNNIRDIGHEFQNVVGGALGGCVFTWHIEPMVKSFPAASAVAAGLKQDKERIAIKQVVETRRRDQGDPKKKCHFIGWYAEEAQRPDPKHNRSIFYRGYDQDNVHYVFGAACEDTKFQACRNDFLKIMESIQFCVK